MLAYVVRRLLWGVFIVFGVISIAFAAVEAVPGDPFSAMQSPKMTAEDLARHKASWGYGPDKTGWDRFGIYLKRLARGDLGTSVQENRPVSQMLAGAIPNTLKLAVAALVLEFVLGVFLGVLAALRHQSWIDHLFTLFSLFFYSMPGFWLALMLTLVFSVHLGWLPRHGIQSPGESGLVDYLKHLVLPCATLVATSAAYTARFQRSALLEVIRQDFVRTARAKGLSERAVVWKHAMRNALLPTITLLGLSLPFLVGGAVITEYIFGWPGMGQLTIKAIADRDVTVVMAVTIVGTTMVLLGSLLADILYAIADPRVRLA
ncbi:MAG: ABC transporter permease [Planctomycetota bacterium]